MNMTSNRDTSLHSDTDTIDDADSIMNLTTIESTEPSSTTTTSTATGVTPVELIASLSSNVSSLTAPETKLDAAIRKIARDLDIKRSMAEYLRQLRNFEIVIVCDDSGSMLTPVDSQQRTRWDELCRIVKMIIPIGVMLDPTGVDIHFLNRPAHFNVKDPKMVDDAFREPPSGFTPLVPVLETIFQSKLADRGRDKKLLVLIATDGAPTDTDGDENIADFERTMRETRKVDTTFVSFLLCTDDETCVDYMREWDGAMENIDVTDDYITERNRIRECQRNNNFPFSHGDYIVKALVGAIDPKIGRLNNFLT